jgi:ankyrin repeat protein
VENDDTAAAEKYLDKLADKGTNFGENDLMDNAGQSMLHKASSLGYAEMLMLLLERSGSKPDLVNGQLATPLHLACRNDRESVVKFLIGCGVDVNT